MGRPWAHSKQRAVALRLSTMACALLIDRLSPNITALRHALDASSLWTACGTDAAPHEEDNCCRYSCRSHCRHHPLLGADITQ